MVTTSCDSTMNTTGYHTLTNSWDSFTTAEFYSWAIIWYLLYSIRVTSLHGTWGITVIQTATSCGDKLFSRYIRQSNPHSFLCYPDIDHSGLTTRDCLIPRINERHLYTSCNVCKPYKVMCNYYMADSHNYLNMHYPSTMEAFTHHSHYSLHTCKRITKGMWLGNNQCVWRMINNLTSNQ